MSGTRPSNGPQSMSSGTTGEIHAPILCAERVRLIPFSNACLSERYVGWLNDPEIVRYSEQRHRHHTLASCRAYVESFAGTPDLLWAIVIPSDTASAATNLDRTDLPDGSCHIGNISAHIDLPNQIADIGILIGERAAWGKGYGSEAWITACRYLLGQRGLRKVTAGTVSTNTGMLHIMERAGMVPDGRRCRHYVIDGQEVDIVHAALFATDQRGDYYR